MSTAPFLLSLQISIQSPLLVLKQLLSSELARRGESFVLFFCQLALKEPFSLEFSKDGFDAAPAAWAS